VISSSEEEEDNSNDLLSEEDEISSSEDDFDDKLNKMMEIKEESEIESIKPKKELKKPSQPLKIPQKQPIQPKLKLKETSVTLNANGDVSYENKDEKRMLLQQIKNYIENFRPHLIDIIGCSPIIENA
jgi:hypothetical protein